MPTSMEPTRSGALFFGFPGRAVFSPVGVWAEVWHPKSIVLYIYEDEICAAYAADSMAEDAAEREREYQEQNKEEEE